MGGGALVGAASMAMAASGMGLALAAAGAAQVAGGAQALTAAFKAAGEGGEGGSGGGSAGSLPGGFWSGGGDIGGGGAGGAEAGASSSGGASTGSTPFAHAAGFDSGAPSLMDRVSAMGDRLAQGAGHTAKSKLDAAKEAWNQRVAETPGGKLAAALKPQLQPTAGDGAATDFEGDALSGAGKPVTPEEEIAAFAARDPSTFDGEDQFHDSPRDNA
jgi:hypothetical protein